jgi:hypothetical protein
MLHLNAHKIFCTIILLNTATLILQSQTTSIVKYELGVNGGLFIYMGDLTPNDLGSFRTMKPVIGISGSRIVNNALAARANLVFGGLRGDESKYANPAYRRQRNLSFRSSVFEISAQMVWNPLGKNYSDKGFSPYLFGGAGLSFLKINRDWSRFNAEFFSAEPNIVNGLAADQNHRVPRALPVFPLGAGLRYFVSPRISVHTETTYRVAFSDYLDGFSEAANPSKLDHYYSQTIGLIYRLGKKNMLGCPVIRN